MTYRELAQWQTMVERLSPERQAVVIDDISQVNALEKRLCEMTVPSVVRGQTLTVGLIHGRNFAAMRAAIIHWHEYQECVLGAAAPAVTVVPSPEARPEVARAAVAALVSEMVGVMHNPPRDEVISLWTDRWMALIRGGSG